MDDKFLFEVLLSNTSDTIYFKDLESRFIRVSDQLARRLGASSVDELIGKTDFDFFSEEHAQQAFEDEHKIIETGEPIIGIEEKETFEDGRVLWSSTSKFPLVNKSGEIIGTVGISRDITAQKNAEEELKANKEKIQQSLKEKEILLAEVHHRVKNNLAVISGLMELQKYSLADMSEQELEILLTTQTRIKSIANVHELLYQTENFADLDISELIKKLGKDIKDSYLTQKRTINFKIDIEKIVLSPNQAVPFCLLMNELIQNSYKHAFKGKSEGTISISARNEDKGFVSVLYSDNGVGLKDGFKQALEDSKSLGFTLINALTEQLDAHNIKARSDNGFVYSFEFRINNQNGAVRGIEEIL